MDEKWIAMLARHDPTLPRRMKKERKNNAGYRASAAKARQIADMREVSDNKDRLAITSRVGLCQLRISAEEGQDPDEDSTHYKHEKAKFDVAYLLKCWGYTFATEAGFIDGRRADVYILNGKSNNGGSVEVETDQTKASKKRKAGLWTLPVLILDPDDGFKVNKKKMREWLEDKVIYEGGEDAVHA